jgi:alanyl-tRNA synthetase
VSPDRLRFDYTHDTPLSAQQTADIERFVAEAIDADLPVEVSVASLAEARAAGATALFGEKYGERVRMVRVGDRSLELCGGTHVRRAGELVALKIVAAGSVAAGTRRVEAVAGRAALAHYEAGLHSLHQVAAALGVPVAEARARAEALVRRADDLQTRLDAARIAASLRPAGQARFCGVPVTVHEFVVAADSDPSDKNLLKTAALRVAEATPGVLNVVLAGGRVAVAGVGCGVAARTVLDGLTRAFNGRGGGGDAFAQAALGAPDVSPARIMQWLATESASSGGRAV